MTENDYYRIPEDVNEIAEGTYAGDKSLRHIDLRNVRYIGAHAFQDCSNLESVIMDHTTAIGPRAFEFCRSLRSVTFGEIREIGEEAFSHCSMLDIPEIPRTLTSAGAGAFAYTALRRADLDWFDAVPAALFRCCVSMESADIRGAREIGEDAFVGCEALTEVKFGPVEKIGARAFQKCDALEFTALPDTLQVLGDDALANTRSGLVIPKSVTHIGRNCLGPVDRKKNIRLYRSALYEFRNYFREDRMDPEEEDHFYLWESSIDVTVLDDVTDEASGFLPLYSDLNYNLRRTLTGAFKPGNIFEYEVLDSDFFRGMGWNQRCRDRLAVQRLKHPYGLTETAREEYSVYLGKHMKRITQRAVKDRDIDMLSFLCESGLIGQDNITGVIDYSIALPAPECTAFLLERQAEMNWHNDPLMDEL